MYVGQVSRNNSSSEKRRQCLATTSGECPSHPLCCVQPIAFDQSRTTVYSPNLNDPCTRCLTQPTTSSHCLPPTLSHSIALTLSPSLYLRHSHNESRSLSHQLPHGVFLCEHDALLYSHTCHRMGTKSAVVASPSHF